MSVGVFACCVLRVVRMLIPCVAACAAPASCINVRVRDCRRHAPAALAVVRKSGVKFDIMATSFFLGRRSVVAHANEGMPEWQDRIYIFLNRNAANPTDFFHIPAGRVVLMGTQVSV
jgi:K+ transporter